MGISAQSRFVRIIGRYLKLKGARSPPLLFSQLIRPDVRREMGVSDTVNQTLKSETGHHLQFLHLRLNCQNLCRGGCESSANLKSLFPSFFFEDALHSSLEDSAGRIGECSNYDERGDVLVSRKQPKLHFKYLNLPQSKTFKSPLKHE